MMNKSVRVELLFDMYNNISVELRKISTTSEQVKNQNLFYDDSDNAFIYVIFFLLIYGLGFFCLMFKIFCRLVGIVLFVAGYFLTLYANYWDCLVVKNKRIALSGSMLYLLQKYKDLQGKVIA